VVVEIIIARCAGLDVHKQTVMAAVRTPDDAGGRREQVRQFSTFTAGLRELREWLSDHGVTQVAMEATGVYWKPVWHMLADLNGVELLLCNAHHVKRVPGRKTDVSDAAWLAQLCEVGLLTGSFVPPPEIARLRDLTRYRKKLINERGRETQRIQKLLEDTGIKLDNVATDILGKSARAMLEALIDGERDPAVLAELARTRMRAKLPELQLAFGGWPPAASQMRGRRPAGAPGSRSSPSHRSPRPATWSITSRSIDGPTTSSSFRSTGDPTGATRSPGVRSASLTRWSTEASTSCTAIPRIIPARSRCTATGSSCTAAATSSTTTRASPATRDTVPSCDCSTWSRWLDPPASSSRYR
jgi:hypothetical protein